MKIVYLSTNKMMHPSHISGYAIHMREIIRAFREKGHEVLTLFAGEERNQKFSVSKNQSYPKQTLKKLVPVSVWEAAKDVSQIWHDKGVYNDFLEKVRAFNPDVIYARATDMHKSDVEIAKTLNIPIVLEYNGPLVYERNLYRKSPLTFWAKKIERERFRLADTIIALYSALKDWLEKMGVDSSKIEVLSNGVSPERFQNADGSKIRNRYGIQEKIVIGFVGSFFRWHGIDVLIESIPKLRKRYSNIYCLIVGDGEIRGELEELTKDCNVEDRVTFTGYVDFTEVKDYIDAMDITVMPRANWYGMAIKIFEYGFMGKAIIAPRIAPIMEVMEDGVDATLITSGSVQELTQAISKYIENPELRLKHGQNFRRKVLEHYTWDKVGEKTLAICEQLIQG